MDKQLAAKLKRIKLLALDVDGVLTDGTFIFDMDGNEAKAFSAHDGMGLKLLRVNGIKTAMISARKSHAAVMRGRDLKMDEINVGVHNKLKTFKDVLKRLKLKKENVCYIGDDFEDIPVLLNVGLSVLVNNAPIRGIIDVDYVTSRNGGCGAVREVIDAILKAQGLYDKTVRHYLDLAAGKNA